MKIKNVIFVGVVGLLIISGFNDSENNTGTVESKQQTEVELMSENKTQNKDTENIELIISDMNILFNFIESKTGERLNNITHKSTSSTFEGTNNDKCYEFILDTSSDTRYLYVTSDMKYVYTSKGEKTKYTDFIDLCLEPYNMELDYTCRYITEEINTFGESINVSTIIDIRDYIDKLASFKNTEESVVIDRLYNMINSKIYAIEKATGVTLGGSAYDNVLDEIKEINHNIDYTPVSNFSDDVNVSFNEAVNLFESQFPDMGGRHVRSVKDGYIFEVVIEGITYSYLVSKDELTIYDENGYVIYSK